MRKIESDIEIDARPAVVWDVLTNFDRYPEWNPFIHEITGTLEEGSKLRLTMEPNDGEITEVKAEVTTVTPEQELRWKENLGFLISGEHAFFLEPLPNARTKLAQAESFSGLRVGSKWTELNTKTWIKFIQMDKALKKRAETLEKNLYAHAATDVGTIETPA